MKSVEIPKEVIEDGERDAEMSRESYEDKEKPAEKPKGMPRRAKKGAKANSRRVKERKKRLKREDMVVKEMPRDVNEIDVYNLRINVKRRRYQSCRRW